MNDSRARIEKVTRLNAEYLQLELAVQDEALKKLKPGQSVLARMTDKLNEQQQWNPYLRERWWPIGVTGRDVLRVEVLRVRHYEPGEIVQLLGPVGLPYRFRSNLRHILLIAWRTPPTALTVMIPNLVSNKKNVSLVLLGDAIRYNTEHLPPEVEVVRGDDTLVWDNMLMMMGIADQIFVAVSNDDELARFGEVLRMLRERLSNLTENIVWGVFQPPMLCGVGACDACALRLRDGSLCTICTEGPAFDLTTVGLR